jgi:hypothetical protein
VNDREAEQLENQARFGRWWTVYWATPPKMPVSLRAIAKDGWDAARAKQDSASGEQT